LTQQKPKTKPTIKDVAKLAGVSFKTVSRVVNNEDVVAEEVREKICRIIKELGYHPNLSARGLRGAAASIGFIYDNPNSHYIVEMQNGILSICATAGYELVIRPCDARADNLRDQVLNMVDRSRVGGLVLTSPISENQSVIDALQERGVEVVRILSGELPPTGADLCPCVYVNDRAAAYQITQYLLQLGHKNIAFLAGDDSHKSTLERQSGFLQAFTDAGLDACHARVLPGRYAFDSGFERCQALLSQTTDVRPTAIFGCNDEIAAGALLAARLNNIPMPEQLSIVGFEDSPFSRQTLPKLTTAAQPTQEIAQQATRLLIEKMRTKNTTGGDPIPQSCESYTPQLVVRDSSAAPSP
jgi:LacI family transcriptional regulator